jgi:hypothetical protein
VTADEAAVFVALGLAKKATAPQPKKEAPKAAPKKAPAITPAAVPAAEPDSAILGLRAEYEAKTGQKPDMRWGLARLSSELADLSAETSETDNGE